MANLIKISMFLTTHAPVIPSKIASDNVTQLGNDTNDKTWNEIKTGHFIQTFHVCFMSIFITNFVQQTGVISFKKLTPIAMQLEILACMSSIVP